MTYGQMFEAAMKAETRAEADAIFTNLVELAQQARGTTLEETQRAVRRHLGYWAGNFSHETRLRVESLFDCVHPYLGAAKDGQLSSEEIFRLGFAAGRQHAGEGDADG